VGSLGKLRRLSRDERWLLLQALVLLPLTALGVRAFGVGRWQRMLAKLTPVRGIRNPNSSSAGDQSQRSLPLQDSPATRQRVRAIARSITIAAEHGIYHPNCLQRSLVLWWLLGRNRIASEIRFGARKEDGELKAHAWVECLGFALNEDQDVCRHYSPFEIVA
jgi:hypothetical protein